MIKWKLVTLPDDSVCVKMTLKSHPGKAIVRDKRDEEFYIGEKVRWYEI